MPRFLHTADLHLNALRRFPGPAYLRRSEKTLSAILDAARDNDVDFIIAAGDIWESTRITNAERKLLSRWLAGSPVPIVMISGNHDTRSEQTGDTALSYLSSMGTAIAEHLLHDGLPRIARYLDCQFVLFPWHGWRDQEMHLMLATMIRAARRRPEPIIVVMHEPVAGNRTDRGLEIGGRNQIQLDDLEGVTYWALGHIHRRQAIMPNAWYPGSPHQTKFDENPDKGVLIVDTDDPTDPEFVPIDSVGLVILDEVPDEWPSEDEAFGSLRAAPEKPIRLPENVELSENVAAPTTFRQSSERVHGILDGLGEVLLREGLSEELLPAAWRMAAEAAKSCGMDVTIPEDYR